MSADLRERAIQLRAEGNGYREIATALGVSATTVQRWCKPDFAQRDREHSRAWKARNRDHVIAYDAEYDAAHKVPCSRCGRDMSRQHDGGICRPCTVAQKEARWRLVCDMWAAGAKMGEIQRAAGYRSKGHIQADFGRIREAGWPLPHRRTPEQRARIMAGRRRAVAA